MAAQKQNLGKDLTLSFSANGQVIKELGFYTDVMFKPLFSDKKIVPINNGGVPVARVIYSGHEVELTFGRRDATGEELALFIEQNYVAGAPEIDVTLTQIVQDEDGTYDTWQYVNGIIYPTDMGSFKTVEDVSQTFKFFFSRKLSISAGSGITVGVSTTVGINL